MSTTVAGRFATEKYASLVTYRRDGTPVATPVWLVTDGDAVLVWTGTRTGKVKRVRHNSTVTLAPCGARGKPRGDAVPGNAAVCDAQGTDRTRELIMDKYGFQGRFLIRRSLRRGGPDATIGLRITFPDAL
jgi:PPOX class probable F420-dependent enzyme